MDDQDDGDEQDMEQDPMDGDPNGDGDGDGDGDGEDGADGEDGDGEGHEHERDSEEEEEPEEEISEGDLLQRRREECERKARRGEMDPRLEFTFQLLMDATGLPRHQIMDHIFEGNMLDEINQLFLPNMRNKLMWFYQEVEDVDQPGDRDANKPGPSRAGASSSSKTPQGASSSSHSHSKHKLFITDGWSCAFTGICIYMFRINIQKQLPEEGFHKDLYCGYIDANRVGLVTSIERIVEQVFMQALAYPNIESEDEEMSCNLVKSQLLPGLRSFCSALRVCEQVCNHFNVFDDGKTIVCRVDTLAEVKEMSRNSTTCAELEERVNNWIKGIAKILMESEQLRRENDSSGPQDELEYWKRRGAQFSQLLSHLQEREVQWTLYCLSQAGSKVLKCWKETDKKITFCYNEARDNSKFIQAMEQCCHSLYLDDPVNMKESIVSLLQTVRLIYSVSQFYNTSERTSTLMVKITNQMIETCKSYITCRGKETIWTQDRDLVRTKLTNCLKLNHIYRETYHSVKSQPFLPDQIPFAFSENYVFGKFDTFCDRLSKIIAMFNLIDDYNHLFERRLEGLLLGEALEDAMNTFDEAKVEIIMKKYDYLDQRNADFNDDFQIFMQKTDTLKETIASMIEHNFDSVWETPQGIRFLVRFEKVSEKIPLSTMDEKYQRVSKYCEKEIDRILKLFRKQRDDPPLPRNFPPIAGRIKWCRSLGYHLQELVTTVTTHPVLALLPSTKDIENRHNSAKIILAEYEQEMTQIWLSQDVAVADACLVQPILALQNDRLVANLHPTIPLLIRESKCLAKLNIELPVVAATLLCKQNHFHTIQDSLNSLIKMFLCTIKKVKLEVRPLFLPQLVRLTAMLKPGLKSINWTNPKWVEFYENCKEAIETFDVLVARVHDIYANRILHVLLSMQDITLQSFPPDDEMWTVEEFLENNEEACRQAAIELNRKSQMVEEAVEEVLDLVHRASQTFKRMVGAENDFFVDEDKKPEKSSPTPEADDADGQGQQQDWSILWSCFENPLQLLSHHGGGLPKGMQDMVFNAVSEMRRYYSRKVIDVLIRVTRTALDSLRRRFIEIEGVKLPVKPIFILQSLLMIPNIAVRPTLDDLQEALTQAGKNITGVSKGVAQWNTGKDIEDKPKPSAAALASAATAAKLAKQNQPHLDDRSRRRKLYRLQSEEKPKMPHMTKSFYSYVMDNKEVVKTLSLLSSCIRNIKPELTEFVAKWKPYHFLWKNDKTARELLECTLLDFESTLRCLGELDANLLVEPEMQYFGQSVALSTEKLKFGLAIEIKSFTHKIGQAMKKKYKREMDYVYAVINEMDRKLDRQIRDLDDVRTVMDTLSKIREQEVDMELKIEPIEEAFNMMHKYDIQVDREYMDQVDNLRYTWIRLQSRAMEVHCKLLEMQPAFQNELRSNLERFKQDKQEYVVEYRASGPMQPGLTPREASDKLLLFQNRFDGMWRKLQTYQSGEELFGLPQSDYPELGQIKKELNLLQKLYKLYNDVIDRVSSYYDIPWSDVDIEEINNELMEFQNRCRKLPKGLKEWPAFYALKRTIDDFNDMCPLLELMANRAMKPRHWQRIMEVTKYTFEFDSEGFTLKHILEAPLLKHKEDIEDICISAMKEKDIEAKLKQVTNEWSAHELSFQTFNNRGELLLRGDTTAETIGQLEDSLMVLGSLLSNRYNAPFRKQIQQWVYDLSNSNDILERWLLVQNMWVYLEAVFVGGDIAKQLPKEAKRFSKIDKSWQKIMQRAHETPGVVACCVGDDLLKQLLPHLQEQLELCQKSLSGYLEKKRMMFPRFFFVSDPALLEILGQASDSHTIQNHLLSIFDNTRFVKFHDIEYNKMMAIISSEGEQIPLERGIRAEGSVETWLTSLLMSMQQSLHGIIRQAYQLMNDPNFSLLGFLDKLPAQVGLLGIQMIWTRDAELALMQARHEKKNEYLGCTDRLVITPLTDRCYITLAQALALSMGGSPCGPAGTGKTETVKDMGKTLAKYVVVFNCSDQMDYRGLGRIYKGLAQSGTWGCFDEFNRIELPVLSVAAQQVAVILTARKEKKKTFIFTDGDNIEMNMEFGVFITMNPGYAGRKELPENLKIQFRTVAMMVPDRQIIIRVKLASCGFLENITLARKFYTLYKLCEEQLTKQVHYDFGLRNILSVLRTLGASKRVNNKDSESTIVMRVLRDMNLSKLIDEDEPLFMSLVTDLFPNQTLEKTSYTELEAAIANQVEEAGLVYHPPWVLKLIQLYETQQVRHGIMTLGPPGAGKSSCIRVLMRALTDIGLTHREMRMNPKAITAAQMFGRLDVATNDWTDGIFSALWRKTLKAKKGEYTWLILDGPVDSIWIENLNSVLDDNKTLTLANGDRLSMAPTCKIIFEPHNIDNASPATVSRNGMVYMSSSGLDWKPILQAWLRTRSPREKQVLQEMFESSFLKIYTWGTQNLTLMMEVLQCNIIQQMIYLLDGLIPDTGEDEQKEVVSNTGSIEGKYREKPDSTIFDFFVSPTGSWQLWKTLVTPYVYPELSTPDYLSILVPIADNVRIDYLIQTIVKQERGVLLIGEQGTAKTVMMKNFMKKLNTETHMGRSFNFSSATSPFHFQKTIESYIEKRLGNMFGPGGGRKLLVFIDDINMPQINEWGDQITNEIVRQTMDMKGFYSLEKPGEFTNIIDVQFAGAMGLPGGGRSDIPARLKRQFSVFNCNIPDNASIDTIFRTLGEGHYNVKRGFSIEVRKLVKRIVPLTRVLWQRTRNQLLPTPAKFHYIFSLRDLSRIWQGMIGTLSTVITSEAVLILLWKNECTRVFADRFVVPGDLDWFINEMLTVLEEDLGPEYREMAGPSPVFVDFMRDAPEPTGEEGEEADMELPKVYEPVSCFNVLRERLKMFLVQFNEMIRGTGMDLVFFPDAMLHLVKISRIIRHPRGNVMLVGVGGSGKQSLTKLASFIAGYKTFQISLTRSYNVANFLEDLKLLYRSCGVQGKGTTFLFTDMDVKEEGFLEYLNNILSSGVISNLFNRDEQTEIVSELTPTMKRENQKKNVTQETVMEYFLQRVCHHLHVVFCFSPVGETFRRRIMRFPALVSGCTVDCRGPRMRSWRSRATFLADFTIDCTADVKLELGLPNDELSVQNALIVTKSSSYPLLIDPQTQGKLWIKSKEDQNELQITSLNHKYFRTHLEDSLSLGRPLLIEDVGMELDPVIDNVLEKNFIKSGSIEKVLVGDKECDVMPGFMLYITTKLPNPPFSPEISSKTSIIDFTVTMRGLEDQLLGRVILMEKSELEAERVQLFESVMKNQRSMKELEGNLLCRLTSTEGSLVDDEALIEVLQETKTTAEEVNQKLKISEVTEKKIMIAREEFRAVAARGSILYFLIVEMSNVNVMYQNSLKQFLIIFDNSITKSTKSNITEERIQIILKYLTYEVWAFTSRSLYERHKQLFTLMLAIKIDYQKGNISHDEFMAFVKGGASLDLNGVAPKPFRWILDITWLNLVEISKLKTFQGLLKKIEYNEREWKNWYETERPELEVIPCDYEHELDVFRKLLLIRSWSPDRTISQARRYIEVSLGQEYGEMHILDLEVTWSESEPRTPLVCILSIGSDPTTQIAALAKVKGIVLKTVSMGQGQEYHARKLMGECMASGGWVLLQNVHLSLSFCNEIIDVLIETEHVADSFRLWVTTETHPQFPIGLLQMAIKFTNEPPQGIRASLKRSYLAFTQDYLDYTSAPQWPPLLYTVAFLHCVVQERRKFGPLGWNIPYEFNQADFSASVQFIQNHLDEMDPKKGVSWQTLCYMLGEVMYGGRVTDDFDKRLLTTFTQVWFSEHLLTPSFEFYKGYRVPISRNIQVYVDYINQLPPTDTPEVFGLHPNADITYQINTAKGILDTILSVQPKEGGGGGGETRESIVFQLASDMLRKLPPQYVAFEVKESLTRMGALLPMNIFLRQEIDRMQRVINTVYNNLCDLKLAIDGTIVMSQYLRQSLDAMYDARIPERWQKISWESTTLGFWYTELLERNQQFRTWINNDRPKVFWMTGFFNQQGFLTAMRQEVTRAHKGWALDSVVLQNQITRHNKEDIHDPPQEGVYVYGLFLEGASLDRRSGKLIESKPKVLYEQMPVIYIYAINTTAGKDPRLYECPIYRKPQRTDQKYVGSIDFETDFNPRHWTLRGVALLCDIK
uniref:Dynein, axonemal, heavy chain 5 n=1 Tax=Anopheles coluzzii TaxID=1518534 RepID=A0A8W7PQG3_ANOCL